MMTDDAWSTAQQREHNLRTFQIQPPEKRQVKKRPIFSPAQLAIAERAFQQAEARKREAA